MNNNIITPDRILEMAKKWLGIYCRNAQKFKS